MPTFRVGDVVLVDKRYRCWSRRDIVTFRPPPLYYKMYSESKIRLMVKRIVATEGDTVEITNGLLFVNGEEQDEDFEMAKYEYSERTVPSNHVFVLGDSRNNSRDSHVWHFLPVNNITGRVDVES